MKNIRVKIFAIAGIPFGLFIAAIISSQNGIYAGSIAGLVAGLLFGGASALFFGFFSGKTQQVQQQREIMIDAPFGEVFNSCVDSLNLIKRMKIQEQDPDQGVIVARTGMSGKSWGDIVRIKLHKIGDTQVRAEITSRPRLPTTLIDYGKNRENIEAIAGYLESNRKKTKG